MNGLFELRKVLEICVVGQTARDVARRSRLPQLLIS
jgi:hypothetical protein